MSDAARARRYRRRQRHGLVVLAVETHEAALVEALHIAGLIGPAETDADAIAAAAARALESWASQFSVTRYGRFLAKQDKTNSGTE